MFLNLVVLVDFRRSNNVAGSDEIFSVIQIVKQLMCDISRIARCLIFHQAGAGRRAGAQSYQI